MIIKNISHNIKNYMAYLLGNSIIQCILFMFFTLIFSPKFMENKKFLGLRRYLTTIVIFMIAFSAAFIIFTTVSFTKYRGKEFGVYFTIGLTSKEIIKILCYENIIISLASFLSASLAGSIFSKLFHMAIGKILKIHNIDIPLSIKVYGAVLLISFVIFLFTTMYQMIFLKRYSVIKILKSKKDSGSTSTILGSIGIIIFIGAVIIFNMLVRGKIKNNQDIYMQGSIVGIVVSIYLLIGFSMTVVVKVMKKFKRTYNNNILFINSLSHRFMSYRVVLYVVTLLVSGGMIFTSFAYSMYKSTEKQIDMEFPYDMSFIVDKSSIKDTDIRGFVTENLGEVKSYSEIEGLNIPNIRVNDDGDCLWRRSNMLVISEDTYKALRDNELNLEKGEIFYCHAEKTSSSYDGGFMMDLSKRVMDNNSMSLAEYKTQHKADEYMYVPKEKKREKIDTIVNYSTANEEYFRDDVVVVNNDDYKIMKQRLGNESITYDILINLEEGKKYDEFYKKLETNFEEDALDTLMVKQIIFEDSIKSHGFLLFICSFMGMMFLVGSAAALYFKTITSIEGDRERSKQLMKIGLSEREINALIIKELGAVFLVPPIIALICIGYYLSAIYDSISGGEYMWKNSLFVFGVYSVIQVIFYLITSNKYKKQIAL